ncbi:hypothetical protein EAL2_c10880 [Peptoclostridium acidaminophilum DSM 3953]|uniref:Uncharacterized protein n=1 Tax=Peptoclostridium acidaminophilum DSM 3953 TaxID=1286171 RepID=W8U636_PEPAC|nr:hypothetical protein [Peptoclostridium acidaminophilum]AHM56386.1 hypothetical protein EAL2_c10880 [Peptoclostridium acidaminophilum DSM 3953]
MISNIDLLENYTALLIAIDRECNPEEAFQILDKVCEGKLPRRKPSESDIVNMIKLRACMTLREIGALYGCDASTICIRIRKYKNSKGMI